MRNYLLLTPGPLSTSQTVREAMLQDWCTWDKDYNEGIVTPIRKGLLAIAGLDGEKSHPGARKPGGIAGMPGQD